MHFNFHLSGDESPEQSRRIANAVLALGGLTTATFESAPTVSAEERAFLDEIMDRSEAQFGAQADENVVEKGKEALTPEQKAAIRGGYEGSVKTPSEVPFRGSPLNDSVNALAGASHVPEAQFTGSLTSDEVRAVESLPDAPPIPTKSAVETKTPTTDHKGLLWDERIHSSSRATNADGTWRYRKNVPDETKRDVEAELRGLVQGNWPYGYGVHGPANAGEPLTRVEMDESEKEFEDAYSAPIVSAPLVPLPPTPPAPPVPTGALQRTYSDVVNLIMARKVQPDTYVAILGMSLPEFAKHVISAPNDATLMFDALDQASRP